MARSGDAEQLGAAVPRGGRVIPGRKTAGYSQRPQLTSRPPQGRNAWKSMEPGGRGGDEEERRRPINVGRPTARGNRCIVRAVIAPLDAKRRGVLDRFDASGKVCRSKTQGMSPDGRLSSQTHTRRDTKLSMMTKRSPRSKAKRAARWRARSVAGGSRGQITRMHSGARTGPVGKSEVAMAGFRGDGCLQHCESRGSNGADGRSTCGTAARRVRGLGPIPRAKCHGWWGRRYAHVARRKPRPDARDGQR